MAEIVFPVIKGSFKDLKIATNINNWTIEHMDYVSDPSKLGISKDVTNEKDIWTYEIPDECIAKIILENGQDSNFRLHFKFIDDHDNWFTAGEFAKISDDNNMNNTLVLLFKGGEVVSSEGMADGGGIKVYSSDDDNDMVEGTEPFIRIQRQEKEKEQKEQEEQEKEKEQEIKKTSIDRSDELNAVKGSPSSPSDSNDGRRTPRKKKAEPIVLDTPKSEATVFAVTKEIGQPSFTMPEGNVLETTKEAVNQTLLLPKVKEAPKGSTTTTENENDGDAVQQGLSGGSGSGSTSPDTTQPQENSIFNPSGSEKSTSGSPKDVRRDSSVSVPAAAHIAPGAYVADTSGGYTSFSNYDSPEAPKSAEEDQLDVDDDDDERRKLRERNQAVSEAADSLRYNTSLLTTILRFFSGFFGSWFGVLNHRREDRGER